MKVGVTGTRKGMRQAQITAFFKFVQDNEIEEFHHGDCVGVDDEAANIVFAEKTQSGIACHIHRRPGPDDGLHRASNQLHIASGGRDYPEKTHFARNRDIVNACDLLVVIPLDDSRQPHGGTWYTYDYAVKRGKQVVVIWPDGRVDWVSEIK